MLAKKQPFVVSVFTCCFRIKARGDAEDMIKPDTRGLYGRTALHLAAGAGHASCAARLSFLRLFWFCRSTPTRVLYFPKVLRSCLLPVKVETLLELRASLDAQTDAGFTALHLCCQRGHLPTLQCLLAAHAADSSLSAQAEDVKILVKHCPELLWPLTLGSPTKHPQVEVRPCWKSLGPVSVSLNTSQRALKFVQADQGETPLHLAAASGRSQVVAILLQTPQASELLWLLRDSLWCAPPPSQCSWF